MEKESDFFSKELTPVERNLYDRQFRLEGWSQKLVKTSHIIIVGVGGLGCEIAKNLAMLGVGKLDLVDLDTIEHSNLNRQVLFAGAKEGEPKAIVASRKLTEINPHIAIKGHFISLERLDPSIYESADLIVGGLDSMNARLNLNAQAIRFRKPLVDGGVSGYHGHVYTIFPYENACYECNPLPVGESDEMAACTVVGVPRKRIHCVFKGDMAFRDKFNRDPDPKNLNDIKFIQSVANELSTKHNFPPLFSKSDIVKVLDRHDPGIITINAVISALESHEAIKILHWQKGQRALGVPIKDYVIFNGMTMKLYAIAKKRNPKCVQCGENVRRANVVIGKNEKCQQIIDLLASKYELNPEMEPTMTVMDFNNINIVDPDQTAEQNNLRHLELITVAGFKEGEIFVNFKFKE